MTDDTSKREPGGLVSGPEPFLLMPGEPAARLTGDPMPLGSRAGSLDVVIHPA